ncbi:unnamed protein product [Tetraodon nigroviridis]|uniref:(spotted green pufferfish) hypothetical protein n=1 Tax=Tetraodon nigroviridis TaxID=99883 RepID=Q4SUR1_TETNG|nr:unnamed protein product [Tetraodon nigroviridis]
MSRLCCSFSSRGRKRALIKASGRTLWYLELLVASARRWDRDQRGVEQSSRLPSAPGASGMSADTKIAELLTELHHLIKRTQEERSRSEHNLLNIQKTHERMQTENKTSPYYRSKLRGLYTTAKADAEAECSILRHALDKVAEIKSLLEERRIVFCVTLWIRWLRSSPCWRRGESVGLLSLLPPTADGCFHGCRGYSCQDGGRVQRQRPAQEDDEAGRPDDAAAAVGHDAASVDREAGREPPPSVRRHPGQRRLRGQAGRQGGGSGQSRGRGRAVDPGRGGQLQPLHQQQIRSGRHRRGGQRWKANPETDPEALFSKDQLVLALYPQTTCFYRALIHAPPHRPQDDYSVLFEDTSYADGYSPPLNVAQRYVVACKENKKK